LGVDLGRAVSARRALAATADAAALAGAGALDEARYRASGAVALDPGAAAARARESAAAQDDRAGLRTVTVDADPARVTVTVTGTVDLTLLRLVRGGRPFVVRVEATARPHLLP
jgi:Flp pilus assembly protein TadG